RRRRTDRPRRGPPPAPTGRPAARGPHDRRPASARKRFHSERRNPAGGTGDRSGCHGSYSTSVPQPRRTHTGRGRPVAPTREKGTFYVFGFFLGRPLGLRLDSSPNLVAVLAAQRSVPKGVPRATCCRIAANSDSLIGRLTRLTHATLRASG